MKNYRKEFMDEAVKLSVENVKNGGGPFGAVIVKDGKIISRGFNQVTEKNDPTCHAEVNAIRQAAKQLNNFELIGCEIYSSCEPCPMCLGAIYWARIEKIYFANTKTDARNIGFDDSFIYEEIETPIENRKIPTFKIEHPQAIDAFNLWDAKEDKSRY